MYFSKSNEILIEDCDMRGNVAVSGGAVYEVGCKILMYDSRLSVRILCFSVGRRPGSYLICPNYLSCVDVSM